MSSVSVKDGSLYSTKRNATLWITDRMDVEVAGDIKDAIQRLYEIMKIHVVDKSSGVYDSTFFVSNTVLMGKGRKYYMLALTFFFIF